MARVLAVSDRFPDDLASGRFLRVHHLCRQLAERHACFFIDLAGDTRPGTAQELLGMVDARSAPPVPSHRGSARRHLRISNMRYLHLSHPDYVRATLALLRAHIARWQIDVVVVFPGEITELALEIDLPKILDYPDCDTLTIRRALDSRGGELSLAQRSRLWLRRVRQGARERALVRGYDLVTTIAEPDRQGLLASSGAAGSRVIVLPNGVAPEALAAGDRSRQSDRSIVFWGNLDFPPNWTAVRFFYKRVFLPYLADAGVTWHLYGRSAGDHLREVMAHPQVRVQGFREHLFDEIVGCGVMVNPMVEGSGLKNKVLEAFACGIPVVSTRLGVEALPVAHDRECLIADDPAGLAAAVLGLLDESDRRQHLVAAARQLVEAKFTWPTIGQRLGKIVTDVVASRTQDDGQRPATREAV
jgi:glycosyltransferase involved in cell wall biosynthesis